MLVFTLIPRSRAARTRSLCDEVLAHGEFWSDMGDMSASVLSRRAVEGSVGVGGTLRFVPLSFTFCL